MSTYMHTLGSSHPAHVQITTKQHICENYEGDTGSGPKRSVQRNEISVLKRDFLFVDLLYLGLWQERTI